MATVPGDPTTPVQPTLPKQFQPTMADFLQAAAIMDQKGRFAPEKMEEFKTEEEKELNEREDLGGLPRGTLSGDVRKLNVLRKQGMPRKSYYEPQKGEQVTPGERIYNPDIGAAVTRT